MFYRVDYLLAVNLAGLIAGALLSLRTIRIEPARLARVYFGIVAVFLACRSMIFICTVAFTNASFLNPIVGVMGDVGGFLFGAMLGIAARRLDRRKILCDPSFYSALCLSSGVSFVIAGMSKTFYMQGMVEFFTQSGYSTPFLKFIIVAEVLGGMGLLIPWTVLPAITGLSVDMFGAIYTHIHNGDSIDDSTGAISALIRFGAIAALWAWRPRPNDSKDSARRRLAAVGVCIALCISAAVSGGMMVRHLSTPSHAGSTSSNGQRGKGGSILAPQDLCRDGNYV
jgi:uncharacterized membrane protein YphA (DoxX/SURF4 family)